MSARTNTKVTEEPSANVGAEAPVAGLDTTIRLEVKKLQSGKQKMADLYRKEKKYPVTGSPMYAPYFGRVMPLVLNGISVHVPLDGTPYMIPESFAMMFNTKIRSVDQDLIMRKRLTNIAGNFEAYAGEKELITQG